jgi:hypothetical protein
VVKRIEDQAIVRQRELMARPLGSIDDAIQLNFRLGIVAGMVAATKLPEMLMELDREEFNNILERERNGND